MLAGAMNMSGVRFKPGSMINDYRVVRNLGIGGMGTVVEVLMKDGQRRALKILHSEYASSQIRERFDRETRLGATLNHRNIVEITDKGEFDGTPYLVMKRLAGTDLSSHLRGAMPFKEAYPFLTQIMDALEYAHNEGVVHRDLKPENIFVCDGEPLQIKLLDFGIAKLLEATDGLMTQTGLRIGTPDYMSPEQVAGDNKNIDRRTDIFALGAIIYFMLTGKKPFSGQTAAKTMGNILKPGFSPTPLAALAPGIPAGAQAMINRALNYNRNARYGSIAEFRDALDRIYSSAQSSSHTAPSLSMETSAPTTFYASEEITPSLSAMTITMAPKRRRGKFRYVLAFLALAGAGIYAGYRFDKPAGFKNLVENVTKGDMEKVKEQFKDWGKDLGIDP